MSVSVCVPQLLDRAVYTLELFLQSARMQSSEILVKTERATKRVLKVKKEVSFDPYIWL